MIVNRVFCYSEDVAKKNGIRLPILELVLLTIVFIISIIVSAMMFDTMVVPTTSTIVFTITMMVFMGLFMVLLINYFPILVTRMRNRMTGYATDTNGRIFKVMAINDGQGLYFGGVAAGGLADQLVGNDSNIGESLGGAIGAAAQFYSMNRSAQYMSHPEIVAKMVEFAPNITGAEVYEILNVHSITDKGKSIEVKCDYKIVRTNTIECGKNLTIEKAFNMFDDLVKELESHMSV